MINLDSISNENNKIQNEKCRYIRDHPYIILIIDSSGSGKTNTLLNLINEQDDIDKIHLYAKDLSESSTYIECSNTMDNVYKNIDHYNPSRKRKILIVFDDMIAEFKSNKNILKNCNNQRIAY